MEWERGCGPVTMDRFGGFVQAPMNCTTFLCLTFLEGERKHLQAQPEHPNGRIAHNKLHDEVRDARQHRLPPPSILNCRYGDNDVS